MNNNIERAFFQTVVLETGNQREKRGVVYDKKGNIKMKTYGSAPHRFRNKEDKVDEKLKEREVTGQNIRVVIDESQQNRVYDDGIVFHSKTFNNLYLMTGNSSWVTERENGKFKYEGKYTSHLKYLEEQLSLKKYGKTMKEIKEEANLKITQSPLKKTIQKEALKKVRGADSLKTINEILKMHKIDRVLTGEGIENYRPSRDQGILSELDQKPITSKMILSVSDELMIKEGYYKPIYDYERDGGDNPILDPNGEKIVKYWGVKEIDYDKFKELGDAYVELVNDYKERQHGKLPGGKTHVLNAVWHFDEKTPHLHIEVSNASFQRDGRVMNKEIEQPEKVFSISPTHEWRNWDDPENGKKKEGQVEMFKRFRNESFEMLRERFFPELTQERSKDKKERTTQKQWKEKFSEMNAPSFTQALERESFESGLEKFIREKIVETESVAKEWKEWGGGAKNLYNEISDAIEQKRWTASLESMYRSKWTNIGFDEREFETVVKNLKDKVKNKDRMKRQSAKRK